MKMAIRGIPFRKRQPHARAGLRIGDEFVRGRQSESVRLAVTRARRRRRPVRLRSLSGAPVPPSIKTWRSWQVFPLHWLGKANCIILFVADDADAIVGPTSTTGVGLPETVSINRSNGATSKDSV